jgi:hypothetical protein
VLGALARELSLALGLWAFVSGVLCSASCYMSCVPLFVGLATLQASWPHVRLLQSCFIGVDVFPSAVLLLLEAQRCASCACGVTWHFVCYYVHTGGCRCLLLANVYHHTILGWLSVAV